MAGAVLSAADPRKCIQTNDVFGPHATSHPFTWLLRTRLWDRNTDLHLNPHLNPVTGTDLVST